MPAIKECSRPDWLSAAKKACPAYMYRKGFVHTMKKIVLMGKSECGKTTLTQALKGEKIRYHKTQYVNNFDVIIYTSQKAPWKALETGKTTGKQIDQCGIAW